MFGGIDLVVIMLILSGIGIGVARGFVANLLDLIAVSGGIILSSFIYMGPVNLLNRFEISGSVVELVCFILTCAFLIFVFIMIFEMLKKGMEIKHLADRFFGVTTGLVIGFIMAAALLLMMSVSHSSAGEMDENLFPKHITRHLPTLYEKTEEKGIGLPKMVYLPERHKDEFDPANTHIRFSNIKFSKFAGFTCLECGEKVYFDGYHVWTGAAVIPRVICTNCERRSDGCQTFEGFHKIYNSCPVEEARKEIMFDCGRWPNRKLISPTRSCPIDGNQLTPREINSPVYY